MEGEINYIWFFNRLPAFLRPRMIPVIAIKAMNPKIIWTIRRPFTPIVLLNVNTTTTIVAIIDDHSKKLIAEATSFNDSPASWIGFLAFKELDSILYFNS